MVPDEEEPSTPAASEIRFAWTHDTAEITETAPPEVSIPDMI